MSEETKKDPLRGLWPTVDTIERARTASRQGVWAALITVAATAFLAALSLRSGNKARGIVDAWSFVDVAVFLAVAFGIYRGSRFAAVAGLVVFVAGKIYQISVTNQFQGAVLTICLILAYLNAIRGTYALHRLRSAAPAQDSAT